MDAFHVLDLQDGEGEWVPVVASGPAPSARMDHSAAVCPSIRVSCRHVWCSQPPFARANQSVGEHTGRVQAPRGCTQRGAVYTRLWPFFVLRPGSKSKSRTSSA